MANEDPAYPQYNPSPDYANAYSALQKRVAANYAAQRGGLNQELATRGVQTSGVSAIPSTALRASQAGEESGLAGNMAMEQARTAVQDRQMQEQYQRQLEMMRQGFDMNSSLQRQLGQQQLVGGLIGGGLGAAGSLGAASLTAKANEKRPLYPPSYPGY